MSTTAGEDDSMDQTTAKIMTVVGESFDKGYPSGLRCRSRRGPRRGGDGMSVVVKEQRVDLIAEVQAAYKVLSEAGRQDLFGLVQKLLEEQQAAKV